MKKLIKLKYKLILLYCIIFRKKIYHFNHFNIFYNINRFSYELRITLHKQPFVHTITIQNINVLDITIPIGIKV
jgi:hypothetical protein